jgi:NADPH:quinone reductase-like Zn-dependent oxidoreductase
MRAFHVPAAGAAPTLSALSEPTAGPGTVLVRVAAAGLNAIDNALIGG